MKKIALIVLLLTFSSMSSAVNGCWKNGKYVMCGVDTPIETPAP